MKTRQILTTIVFSMLTMIFTSCNKALIDDPLNANTIATFNNHASDVFFESDGWTNEDVFNVWWNKDNVTYGESGALLTISERESGSEETNDQYNGGELRSYQYFGFGDYQIKMKPGKKVGTASTFFTCTGPYELDELGNPNPHDEIDIEFLGKDTTKVQFNYFVDGQGGHEYMYNLGFDASKEFHEYGFRWTSTSITWFVDNKPVYKVQESSKNKLPKTPGRILMNYWCGNKKAEGWMGQYSKPDNEGAIYEEVKTSAKALGKLPIDDWENCEEMCFESTDVYNVNPSGIPSKEIEVSYENVKGQSYKNIQTDISLLAKGKTKCSITFVNNGQKEVRIRVDIQGSKVVSTGSDSSTDACNQSSISKGGKDSYTDLIWGGSFITIEKGKEATLVITYSETLEQGPITNLLIYLDSSTNSNDNHSNHITLKNIIFA